MPPLEHPVLGPILGVEADGITSYRGIPFAHIPCRFARSVLQTSLEHRWTLGGIFDATRLGPTSIQPFHSPTQDAEEQSIPTDGIDLEEGRWQSEFDCLNLTVHVPSAKWGESTNESQTDLPVLVFLHGGAFIWGSGDRSFYDPATLLQQAVELNKPIILVTANYRLGALGFLHSPTAKSPDGELLLPPNNGFYDQRILFDWVSKYIAGFGGDPDNITTIGQSAGAESLSIHNMLASNAGMYRRSILLSGSLMCMPAMSPVSHEFEFKRIARQTGSKVTGRTSAELAYDLINQVEVDDFRDLGWHGVPCLETEIMPYSRATLATILGSSKDYNRNEVWGRSATKRWVSEQIVSSAKFDGGVTYHAVKSDTSRSRRQDHNLAFRQLITYQLQRFDMERSPGAITEEILELYGIHADTDDDVTLRAINQLETDLSFILPTVYEAMAVEREGLPAGKMDIQEISEAAPVTKTFLQLWQLPNPFDGLLEAGKYANHTYDIVSFFGAFEHRLDEAQRLVVREWRAKLIDFICFGGDATGWTPWTEKDGHAVIVDLDGIRNVTRDSYMGPRTRLGRLMAIGNRMGDVRRAHQLANPALMLGPVDPVDGLDDLFRLVVRPYLFNERPR